MPTGIIMQSSSIGATKEDLNKVLVQHGYETEEPEAAQPAEVVEPKREDFADDAAFETAQEEFETKQEAAEEAEQLRADEEEKQRLAALPKKSRRQKAVEHATKQLQEQLRKSEERIAALEGKGAKPDPKTVKTEELKAPERAEFNTDAEYEEAMFDYRYQLRRAKEQSEQKRTEVQAQLKENFETYQTQVAAFKEEHDDWDEVVNSNVKISQSVYLAIVELKDPQVTYYLGKHPDFTRRLAEMTDIAAVVEIGRLADRLSGRSKSSALEPGASDGGSKPKPKPRVNPEPVRPVSTSATSSTLTSREAAANRDFKAFKAAQRKGA